MGRIKSKHVELCDNRTTKIRLRKNHLRQAGFEVQAVLDASGSSFEIGEEMSRRRMERAGVWLTSTNTMVAELV
jgi:hypothetical protein